MLNRVHQLDRGARVAAARETRRYCAARIGRPGEAAKTVRVSGGGLRGVELQLGVENLSFPLPDGLHLSNLLLQGHAAEQILDAGSQRSRRILVQRGRRRVQQDGAKHDENRCGGVAHAQYLQCRAIRLSASSWRPERGAGSNPRSRGKIGKSSKIQGAAGNAPAQFIVPPLVALALQARKPAVRHHVDRRQQRARQGVDAADMSQV
jgi:hypothetical protein